MFVRAVESVAYDAKGDGRIQTLIPGRDVELPDDLALGLIRAGYVFEVDETRVEAAVAGPSRKRSRG